MNDARSSAGLRGSLWFTFRVICFRARKRRRQRIRAIPKQCWRRKIVGGSRSRSEISNSDLYKLFYLESQLLVLGGPS
jgi:hypothetical protein